MTVVPKWKLKASKKRKSKPIKRIN